MLGVLRGLWNLDWGNCGTWSVRKETLHSAWSVCEEKARERYPSTWAMIPTPQPATPMPQCPFW